MRDGLPEGVVAYREYDLPNPAGGTACLAFLLGDKRATGPAANYARKKGAVAYGLVSVRGWPDAPRSPLVWTQDFTQLGVAVIDEDDVVGRDVRAIIGRYLAVFFHDIQDVAPELAALKLFAEKARPDRTVN